MSRVIDNAESLKEKIKGVVEEYLDNEEAYSDNVQLEINTENFDISIADPEQDLPNCDYYEMMDLVRGSESDAGIWIPDEEAIAQVVADYMVNE